MKLPDSVLNSIDSQVRYKHVPNQVPDIGTSGFRLAIIGECPQEEDEKFGNVFLGAHGKFLTALLSNANIKRSETMLGNVCQYRPPNGDVKNFSFDGPELSDSLDRLTREIEKFNPNFIVLLGKFALKIACGEYRSLESWRGSMFICDQVNTPFYGRKCMATYPPHAVLKQYDWAPLLRFDLNRARQEATSPTLAVLERRMRTGLSVDEIIQEMDSIVLKAESGTNEQEVWVSFDLEGYWNRITRFSISTSPTEGFIVPITSGEYDSHWTPEDEGRIWVATSKLLKSPYVRKVLQNSLYDRFVLAYVYKILISNVEWDTMVGHWELYCELLKSLGFQASIYTREPYWKDEREDEDLTTREIYCIKDSAVTEEIRQVQKVLLERFPQSYEHFRFNMDLLDPFLYMELRGIRYDIEGAAIAREGFKLKLWELKHSLNVIAGRMWIGSKADLLKVARDVLCKKKEAPYVMVFAGLVEAALKDRRDSARRLAEMEAAGLLDGVMTNATLGEIEYLLDIEINVDSSKQMNEWIYMSLGFERQYKKNKDGTKALSCDVNSMLTLYRKTENAIFKTVLQIRALLYQVEVLGIKTDPDGRIRCAYNPVGPDTGRISCYESPTGSGYNLQTVTKKLRYLINADEGKEFFQCDLAGADGWTVAARCKQLGDDTMWDDYKFGLKPARIIAQMYMQIEKEVAQFRAHYGKEPNMGEMQRIMVEVSCHINRLSREDLKKLGKEVDPDGWLYFGSKRVQHGSNYGSKQNMISTIILKDSYKFTGEPIYVAPETCGRLQSLYLSRYVGIPRWHKWVENQLLAHEKLTAASGSVRRFFGRIRDGAGVCQDTWRTACSHEPQHNTTYATNLALLRLWSDPENRDSKGRLIIEPLHQVHDALIGQFPTSETMWAVQKIRSYMYNEINIAGQVISIPYEGAYGPSWGDLSHGTI